MTRHLIGAQAHQIAVDDSEYQRNRDHHFLQDALYCKNKYTPSPIEAHLGFWLRFVSNHVSISFQQLLEEKDVTVTEWVALRTLWSHGETTHAELILALGMTKGMASKVVSRLEEKGLAARQLAQGSAREQSLFLVAAGKALVPQLAAMADANDAHFFGHLPPEERQALILVMKGLVQRHHLKEIPTA